MPTTDLTDDKDAAVTAIIRRAIEQDRFPLAPRLDLGGVAGAVVATGPELQFRHADDTYCGRR
jgi:hypothetical protein